MWSEGSGVRVCVINGEVEGREVCMERKSGGRGEERWQVSREGTGGVEGRSGRCGSADGRSAGEGGKE